MSAPEVKDGDYPDLLKSALYATTPFNYLANRIICLLAMRDRGEELLELIPQNMGLAGPEAQRQVPEAREEAEHDRWRFFVTESQVVLHHASETVLRLYLGHVENPAYPWIEIARERNFRTFRKRVDRLRESVAAGEEIDRIHEVFHGTARRTDILQGDEPPAAVIWESAGDVIGRFLAKFAAIVLDSNAYNAAKHGLVLAADQSTANVAVAGKTVTDAEGPALKYLVDRTDGGEGWALEAKWIDPDHSIALSLTACHLIRQMWIVARHRYLGADLRGFDLLDGLNRLENELVTDPKAYGKRMVLNFRRPDERPPESVMHSESRPTGGDAKS